VIIRPIIRPMIVRSQPQEGGELFVAVGQEGNRQFNDGIDDWIAYWWEFGAGTKTFTLGQPLRIYWEIIAGGGPGGNSATGSAMGGGGGAGGRLLGDDTLGPGTYTVIIGNGGLGSTSADGIKKANGENSLIMLGEATLAEAIGGGAGGANQGGEAGQRGEAGGSGGAASGGAVNRSSGLGTIGQGNNGGSSFSSSTSSERASGGGGGAGSVGESAVQSTRGLGGAGVQSDFIELPFTVCVGGDGCSDNVRTQVDSVGFGSGGHGQKNQTTTLTALNGRPGRIAIRFNPV
jgi:hypothetical protein